MTGDARAEFRPGQLEAIRALVDDRSRVLVVQRTGWGKSAVYFIATRLLRDRGAGASLLISPLLALMRNQIEMAERVGVKAVTINSANREAWDEIEETVRDGHADLLLVSPERLNNPRFRQDVLPHVVGAVGMLVVDEAHCISDWGHDFRPDYRRVARVLDRLPSGVPVLCTTATANQRVIDDIVDQLGDDLRVLRGTLDRESLSLGVVKLANPADRLAWLAQEIPQLPGSGIVYCLTVADTERVARWLRGRNIDALAYSGESDDEHRLEVEDALASNRVKVVVATSALGMGYDKPDLGFVVHYQSPGSPIAYYQQVGRAGRALDTSFGILLVGHEDVDIQDWFIRTAFPPREQAEEVIELLAASEAPMKLNQILEVVNIRRTRLEAMLKVLEVEGAVERSPEGGWLRTAQPWAYDQGRVDDVTAIRRAEQAAMRDYVNASDCLMQLLRRQLDDSEARPCGRCANCTGRVWDTELDRSVVGDAIQFLRSATLIVDPRLAGVPKDERLESGRALSVYDDHGWGSQVARGRSQEAAFPDELVAASARLIRGWSMNPAPTWLTSVPSLRNPMLVREFTDRLARALDLPFVDAIEKVRETRPQKEMENTAQQQRNVYGAFTVKTDIPDGPVLLVDDISDSRWTVTVVGGALRRAGSGPVYPFVLATAVGA